MASTPPRTAAPTTNGTATLRIGRIRITSRSPSTSAPRRRSRTSRPSQVRSSRRARCARARTAGGTGGAPSDAAVDGSASFRIRGSIPSSVIEGLPAIGALERDSGSVEQRLGGGAGAAHQPGDIGDGQVVQHGEGEDGPLSRRQRAERLADRGTIVERGHRGGGSDIELVDLEP